MSENQFELILCIVNAGYSQNVMDAARQAGARGGTILRGRGSANPEAEEFFNITIQSLGFKSVMAVRYRRNAAMRRILASADDQIIYFE